MSFISMVVIVIRKGDPRGNMLLRGTRCDRRSGILPRSTLIMSASITSGDSSMSHYLRTTKRFFQDVVLNARYAWNHETRRAARLKSSFQCRENHRRQG